MSTTTKWIIALVIIALVGWVLWSGSFTGAPSDDAQSAAVVNAPLDVSDATLASEAAAIDVQMKVAGNQYAELTKAPSKAGVDLIAGQFSAIVGLMQKTANRLQTRTESLKSVGIDTNTLQAALSDLALQVSYASNQIGAGGQAVATAVDGSAEKNQKAENAKAYSQALIELQKGLAYLQAAQKDVHTAVDAFKVISSSQGAR